MATQPARAVNTATVVAFVIAGVFAVGDWTAKVRHDEPLEYVCKPATLAALTIAAIALDPVADAHSRRVWFVLALLASLKGDVWLMLPERFFVLGLASFMIAHALYLGGFWTHGPAGIALAIASFAVVLVVVPVARRILGSLHEEPELRIPVAAYIVVISAMLATAIATGNALAGVGAGLFVTSDSMIAWNRFVRPFAAAEVLIMVTYHLGQAGLVVSLLR
jgi:uncharacterized membrane protein YhhN